ncbi:hypothetical protein MKW94_008260 [Papaver nudicaule]|uniref:J domain-containing protein n=1 Tax=Papaver nudicaule TaxID=74823 RepID=A0AA41VZZ8_PAPNU|nr:hypothetical protein [Papaver nudicaule]
MDHYEVLGLDKNATKSEIREAYKKLALKYHPDKHFKSSQEARDEATRKFTQVSEAYNVLIDDQKRAIYHLRSASAASVCGTDGHVFRGTDGCASGRYAFNVNPPRYSPKTNSEPLKKTEKTDHKTPIFKAFGTFNGLEVTSRGVICFGGFVLAGALAVGSAVANKLAS